MPAMRIVERLHVRRLIFFELKESEGRKVEAGVKDTYTGDIAKKIVRELWGILHKGWVDSMWFSIGNPSTLRPADTPSPMNPKLRTCMILLEHNNGRRAQQYQFPQILTIVISGPGFEIHFYLERCEASGHLEEQSSAARPSTTWPQSHCSQVSGEAGGRNRDQAGYHLKDEQDVSGRHGSREKRAHIAARTRS